MLFRSDQNSRDIRELFIGQDTQVRSLLLSNLVRDDRGRCRTLDLWWTPLPGLQTLILLAKERSRGIFTVNFDQPFPSLHHLGLQHVGSWAGRGAPNLTKFVLRSCGSAMSYSQFFDFLAGTPRLQCLRVEHCQAMLYDVPAARKLAMTCLSQISTIAYPPPLVEQLLRHLQPASYVSVLVQDHVEDNNLGSLDSYFNGVHVFEPFNSTCTLAVTILEDWGHGTSPDWCDLVLTFHSETFTATLWFHDIQSHTVVSRVPPILGTLLASCNITEVWCGAEAPLMITDEGDALTQFLIHKLPDVTTFGLSGSAFDEDRVDTFSPPICLIRSTLGHDTDTSNPIIAPTVQELRIAAKPDGGPLNLERLQKFLEMRKSAGSPLARVLLQQCDAYQQCVPELSELVDEVLLVNEDTFASSMHLAYDHVSSALYRRYPGPVCPKDCGSCALKLGQW